MFVLAALIVGLIAALFAIGIRWATATFDRMATARPWLPFLVCPTGLAVIAFLTRTVFPGAQGSGIPQAMAGLRMPNPRQVDRLLSWRIAIGKLILVMAGFLSGASIGKEGPIVQIGCSVMNNIGRIGMPRTPGLQRLLIAAGGAAGIAGIFNAPFAGAIFAIEEMSHHYDAVTGRSVLASAMLSGLVLFALFGASAYFGSSDAILPFGPIWLIILPAGLVGGLAGGLFGQILIRPTRFLPGAVNRFAHRHPVAFAFGCGLAVALLGWLSGGRVFDASYDQARAAVHGAVLLPMSFAPLKWAANLVSYLSGIPGGIFSPALAVGAGIGAILQRLLMLLHLAPAMPTAAIAMIGMAAYFSGLVQSPITAAVIVIEMTNDLDMTVAVGLAAGLGAICSKLVCPVPVYEALARQFFAAVAEPHPNPVPERRPRRRFFT